MNDKGFIFDLIKLENGWVITLFSLFKFGYLSGDEDFRHFKCIQLGLWKLEFTFSLAWKTEGSLSIDNIEGLS